MACNTLSVSGSTIQWSDIHYTVQNAHMVSVLVTTQSCTRKYQIDSKNG